MEALKRGWKAADTFRETLITSYPIQVGAYPGRNLKNDFAILDGSDDFSTGWAAEPGTSNTYRQAIPYTGFSGYGIGGIGSYSYMYVTEIDKALEKTAPFTARKILAFVPSPAEVEQTPGSFYSPVNSSENPKQFYIHTSDGTLS